jgi:hypothetical protein
VSLCTQVLFVAPANSREEALKLASQAKALNVRPSVLARWARFLVASGQSRLHPELHGEQQPQLDGEQQPQLNSAMLEWCDRHAEGAAVVPEQITRSALHANNAEQARIILHMFNRGREGYANTRSGHADDPEGEAEPALAAWELPHDGPPGAWTCTQLSDGCTGLACFSTRPQHQHHRANAMRLPVRRRRPACPRARHG